MAKMKIAQAQQIVKDSRYGSEKKKEARLILREAKKAGKLKPKKKAKASTKASTKPKRKAKLKPKRKAKLKPKRKVKPTLRKKTKTTKKKSTKKLKRAKKSKASARAKSKNPSTKGKLKFYDVKNKKYVRIPRTDCKIRRNRSARGGDRLIGKYKGRKLHTFVKKGFKL